MDNHDPKIFNRTKFQQLSLDDLGSTAIWNNPFHGSHTSSNHDFNCDCNCLETSSERKQNPFVWFDVSICVVAFESSASQHSIGQLPNWNGMNSDANIVVHLSNRPNVNSQRKRVGFVEFFLPIYGGSLLKCQLCKRCGKVLSTCNEKLHISCMLHVFELLCLNNKKKLQCTGNKRSYSIVNTNLEWIIYCLLLRTKNGQSERSIYQFLSKALIFVATRH